jgi:hypothetical protein
MYFVALRVRVVDPGTEPGLQAATGPSRTEVRRDLEGTG